MDQNDYSEIFLHFTWHTKLSRPLLSSNEIEAMTYRALGEKAAALGDMIVHGIGGTATHVHLAISIEPTVTISEMVGALKGYSSHEVNRRSGMGRKVLQWQTGYGVVSFGARDLPWVLDYIRNQKEHHDTGRAQDRLERITRFDDLPSAEAAEEAP